MKPSPVPIRTSAALKETQTLPSRTDGTVLDHVFCGVADIVCTIQEADPAPPQNKIENKTQRMEIGGSLGSHKVSARRPRFLRIGNLACVVRVTL